MYLRAAHRAARLTTPAIRPASSSWTRLSSSSSKSPPKGAAAPVLPDDTAVSEKQPASSAPPFSEATLNTSSSATVAPPRPEKERIVAQSTTELRATQKGPPSTPQTESQKKTDSDFPPSTSQQIHVDTPPSTPRPNARAEPKASSPIAAQSVSTEGTSTAQSSTQSPKAAPATPSTMQEAQAEVSSKPRPGPQVKPAASLSTSAAQPGTPEGPQTLLKDAQIKADATSASPQAESIKASSASPSPSRAAQPSATTLSSAAQNPLSKVGATLEAGTTTPSSPVAKADVKSSSPSLEAKTVPKDATSSSPVISSTSAQTAKMVSSSSEKSFVPKTSSASKSDRKAEVKNAASKIKPGASPVKKASTVKGQTDSTSSKQAPKPLDLVQRRLQAKAEKKKAAAAAAAVKVVSAAEAAKARFQSHVAHELQKVYLSDVTSAPGRKIVPLQPRAVVVEEAEEREWHSEYIQGRASLRAYRHVAPYRVPVAILHFRSHFHPLLDLFTHFVEHAAASLGVPITGTAKLPTQRSLWTVIRGPFAHKKSQENFHRLVHKRAIRAFDADPEIIDRLVMYLERHAMEGVGMRVVRWHRVPVGIGRSQVERVAASLRLGDIPVSNQIKQLGDQIIVEESKVALEGEAAV